MNTSFARALWIIADASQLVLCAETPAAPVPAAHVRNFGQVNGQIYRGGEPSQVGLEELAAMGIKLDIDLRQSGTQTDAEKKTANSLGMRYINVPIKALSAPTRAEVENVLSLLINGGTQPVFVHCRRGKDRTGTIVACYRVQHDGWDNQRALQEATSYGMSVMERGMRSYILKFQPLTLPGSTLRP